MTNGKRGPLFLLLFGALMAGAGNGISLVAFPWLVLQRNGSALDASIVAMAGTLPLLAATLIAGAAVDYLGRRRVSMISDALSALSVAAVPLLALAFGVHVINVAVLAGLAALGAFFDPAGMTARETMLPEAAMRAGWTQQASPTSPPCPKGCGRELWKACASCGTTRCCARWRSSTSRPPACTCR